MFDNDAGTCRRIPDHRGQDSPPCSQPLGGSTVKRVVIPPAGDRIQVRSGRSHRKDMLRRAVAFAASLLLLQAFAAPAGFACEHMRSFGPVAVAGMTSHQSTGPASESGMPMQTPAHGTQRSHDSDCCPGAPGSMPCTSGTCASLAGCGVMAFVIAAPAAAFTMSLPDEIHGLVQSPRVRTTAPELPPPRA